MDRMLLPLIVLGALLLIVTLWRPDFWTVRGELPFDDADATRGDWDAIPSQGHPEDVRARRDDDGPRFVKTAKPHRRSS